MREVELQVRQRHSASDWNLNELTLAPTASGRADRPAPLGEDRPADSRCAHGNPDAEVPQTAPLDAALIGILEALAPIASETS